MEAVLIAFFGSVTAFFSWRSKVHAKGTRDDVKTNNGRRPGDYIESAYNAIAEVKAEVINGNAFTNARIDGLAHEIGKQGVRITALERS